MNKVNCFVMIMAFILYFVIAGKVNAESVTFEWTIENTENITGFRLYISETQGEYVFGKENAKAELLLEDRVFEITDFEKGKNYYAVMTSYNSVTESEQSNEILIPFNIVPPVLVIKMQAQLVEMRINGVILSEK